jgi:dienelactone hydrolase
MARETLAQRWTSLEPHVRVYGPEDRTPRPAVLIFHGCGGMRGHLDRYAEAAAQAGFRVFSVDSYAPRGWSQAFGLAFVCTALAFRGWERAGDIAATIHGVSARPDVDASRLALAGFSHGGWGIMELMAAPRARPGELGLADPHAVDLKGVRCVVLAYPYIGFAAARREAPWRHRPATLAIIARRDHLTTVRNAERVHGKVKACGVEVETWIAEGTHAFDEPMNAPPMRYDPELLAESLERFSRFLTARLG